MVQYEGEQDRINHELTTGGAPYEMGLEPDNPNMPQDHRRPISRNRNGHPPYMPRSSQTNQKEPLL